MLSAFKKYLLLIEKRPELINDIFYGYGSALDSTTAMLAEPLYKLYPDAKFILVCGCHFPCKT